MEYTFENLRKEYYLRLDIYNVLNSLECKIHAIYESKPYFIFIDTYDILSYTFPPGLLFEDIHGSTNKFIYQKIFSEIEPEDPIKFSMTPASCLEFFYILEEKAFNIFKRTSLTDSDIEKINSIKNERELEEILKPYSKDLMISKSLLSETGKPELNYIDRLLELMRQKKMYNCNKIFDYSKGDPFNYNSYSANLINSKSIRRKLTFARMYYKKYCQQYNLKELSELDLGINDFSIAADISSGRTTVFLNKDKNKLFHYVTNGFNFLIAFEKSWRGKKEDMPFSHSFFCLLLARFFHSFNSSEKAKKEIYHNVKCHHEYLKEFYKIESGNNNLSIYRKSPDKNKVLGNKIIRTSKKFDILNDYIKSSCAIIHLDSKQIKSKKFIISTSSTGISHEEIIEYAHNGERIKETGKRMHDAGVESVKNLVNFEEISHYYLPPDGFTTTLLRRLKGSSYN